MLTEIDIKATLKAKIDVDVSPYLIIGACNPKLANRGLSVEPSLGLLLPCNVVVRETGSGGEGTVVEMLDPHTMVTLTEVEALAPVATEAAALLAAAMEDIAHS